MKTNFESLDPFVVKKQSRRPKRVGKEILKRLKNRIGWELGSILWDIQTVYNLSIITRSIRSQGDLISTSKGTRTEKIGMQM